ncbi:MAG: murein hydrolase activator EnvC family protein [Bacteroidia bacterium]
MGILLAQPSNAIQRERLQLEKKRQRIEQDILFSEQLLMQARTSRKRSFQEMSLLQQQIRLREKLLTHLQKEIESLDQEIQKLGRLNIALQRDIQRIRKAYLQVAYRTSRIQGHITLWMWLLSAENFKQAYYRFQYFKALMRLRNQQLQLLQRMQRYLLQRSIEYQKKRAEREKLFISYQAQAQKLSQARNEKKQLYKTLMQKEKDYKQKIQKYRHQLANVQARIDNLIRKEMEKAKKTAQSLTEAQKKLSQVFEKNKGRLPWPLPPEKSIVASPFGLVEDISGALIENQGVYLSTRPHEIVRAIFSGKVSAISTLPTYGKVLIIQHGNYRSVYTNLEEVFVSQGQEISILTPIGKVASHPQTQETTLYFLIYRDKTPVNPLEWLSAR